MIKEKATRLSQLSAEVRNANSNAAIRSELLDRLSSLADLRSELQNLLEIYRLLMNHGVIRLQDLPNLYGLIQRLDDFLKNLEQSHEVARTHAYGELQQHLEEVVKDLRSTFLKHWRQYASRKAPSLSDDLLDVLSHIPSLKAPIEELRQLKSRFDSLGRSLPTSGKAIGEFLATVERCERKWRDMLGSGVPDAVVAFLREATGQGAALELLVPEVLGWFKERNLEHLLRIRI